MRSRLKDVTSVDQLYVQVLADAAKPITRPRDLKTRKVLSVAVDYDILSSDASRNAMVGADVCYVPVPGGGAASRSDPQSQRMGLGTSRSILPHIFAKTANPYTQDPNLS